MPENPVFDFKTLPLRPAEFAVSLGATVVVAPHPDDESLGCGGLIALLRQAAVPVQVILVSDGTTSHPHSVKFPAAARQALREQELRTALAELGCASDALLVLNLPDGKVPTPATPTGAAAVQQLTAFLQRTKPATVLCPWRRDPHPDHYATSALVRAALSVLPAPPRLLEYVVWAWERASLSELPQPDEATGWRLDISSVLPLKQRAIASHRSQLAPGIIDDDPTGFQLSAEMLAHFALPFEAYLEVQ